MPKYTEWCPYCDAETDYDKGWRMVKCCECGAMLMPCDWCITNGIRSDEGSDCGQDPCAVYRNQKFKKSEHVGKRSKTMTIPLTWDTFESMLWERNAAWGNAPAYVVDYYLQKLKDNGGCSNPENNDPKIIMDNIAVNGYYGSFDNWRLPDEMDDDFIDRIELEYPGVEIFKDERVIILPSPTMESIIYGK